jgi:hypothetical protein
VAILRLSVHRRGPGALHIVLESMHSEPPYVLENRTRFPLQYRQVGFAGCEVVPLPSCFGAAFCHPAFFCTAL